MLHKADTSDTQAARNRSQRPSARPQRYRYDHTKRAHAAIKHNTQSVPVGDAGVLTSCTFPVPVIHRCNATRVRAYQNGRGAATTITHDVLTPQANTIHTIRATR